MIESVSSIETLPKPECIACGSPGNIAYQNLRDRLFNVSGEWSMRRCSNEECGLHWLDPTPAEHDLSRLYVDYFTHQLPSTTRPMRSLLMETARSAYYAHKLGRIRQLSAAPRAYMLASYLLPSIRAQWDAEVFYQFDKPFGRLLEIGCGNGAALERLSGLGWNAEGVDFDPKAVEAAKSRGLAVRQGDLVSLAFPESAFDRIVMGHVIEHVADPRALLRECHRVLKPGGQLISITPNATGWGHRRYGRDWLGLDAPRHLHVFGASSMRRLAKASGFSQVQVSSVAASAHLFLWYSMQLQSRQKVSVIGLSPLDSVKARLMQLLQWIRIMYRQYDGEELVLKAAKGF